MRVKLYGPLVSVLLCASGLVLADGREDLVTRLKNNLMCTCPCTHRVGQCGDECLVAPQHRSELRQLVEAGGTEQEIYAIYEKKYGVSVLAAPRPEGFNLLAWVTPFAVLLLGIGVVVVAARRLKPTAADHPAKRQEPEDQRYRRLLEKELEE